MEAETILKDFLEKTYFEIDQNIKFSEAKNAAIITLNSALVAVCSDKLFDVQTAFCWKVIILIATILLLIPLILSVFSFRATTGSEKGLTQCFYNILMKQNKVHDTPEKLMFYSYISKKYSGDHISYLNAIEQKDNYSVLETQLAIQIIDLSNVAYRKFMLFNIAVKIESLIFASAAIIGVLVLLLKIF